MSTVLTFLVVAGIAAAAWHFLRAAFRFLRHGATGYWTGALTRTHARLGDVTAMEEAKRERAAVARWRRRDGLLALGWLGLLVAPSFTAWARPMYGAYASLWAAPVVRCLGGRRVGSGARTEGRGRR